ncbi:unnamed protein product, partial [Prorocentrum cordatum]
MPSDLLQCPVCLEQFQEPQVLPGCGHTFCAACVRQVCEAAAASGSTASCPTCRQAFVPGEVRANFVLADVLREHAEVGSGAGSPIPRRTNDIHLFFQISARISWIGAGTPPGGTSVAAPSALC